MISNKWMALFVSLLITGMTVFYPTSMGRGLPLVYRSMGQWNYIFLIIDVFIWFIVIYALTIIWEQSMHMKQPKKAEPKKTETKKEEEKEDTDADADVDEDK